MKPQSLFGWIGLIAGTLFLIILCSILAFFAGKVINIPNGIPSPTLPFPTLKATVVPTFTPTPTPTATPSPPTPTYTPTIPPTPIVTPLALRNIGKLITVEQDLLVYLTYETKPDWWPFSFWTNKIILLAVGTVQAGIDMDKIKDEDLVVRDATVEITLPPPEFFGEPNLDLDKTQALEGSTFNPITGIDWNQMIKAQRDAKEAMHKWVLEHGLLDTARKNAEMRIELLLRRLGATQVTIKWQDYEK